MALVDPRSAGKVDRGDAEAHQMRDGGRVGEAGEGAAQRQSGISGARVKPRTCNS